MHRQKQQRLTGARKTSTRNTGHLPIRVYIRSEIKTSAIASGQFSYSAYDVFQGMILSRLIIGLVSSAAFNGD